MGWKRHYTIVILINLFLLNTRVDATDNGSCPQPIHSGSTFQDLFYNGDLWNDPEEGKLGTLWSSFHCRLYIGQFVDSWDPEIELPSSFGNPKYSFQHIEVQKALDGETASANQYLRLTTRNQIRNLSKSGFYYINRPQVDKLSGYSLSSSFANIHNRPGGGNNPPFSLCSNASKDRVLAKNSEVVLCHGNICTHDIGSKVWRTISCVFTVNDCYNAMLESCVPTELKLIHLVDDPEDQVPDYRNSFVNIWTFFASNDMQGGVLTDANGDRYASNVVGGTIVGHHALSHAGEYGNGNYKVDFIIQRRDSVQTMENDLIANLQVYSWNRNLVKEEIDVTASMIPVGSGWVNITMEVTLATHELDDIGFKLKMYPGLHEIGYRRVHIKYLYYDTVAPTQVPSQMPSQEPPHENFALSGTASQSCQSLTWQNSVDAPINGITSVTSYRNPDGTVSGEMSVSCTEQGAWWQVDLGRLVEIYKIKIYNRRDCCTDLITNADVKILDSSYVTVASRYIGLSTDVPIFEFDFAGGVVGKIVRHQLRGVNAVTLVEVEVWGIAGPPLPTISLTDRTLFYISTDKKIYYKDEGSSLLSPAVQIRGSLNQISHDPVSGLFCGVININDHIFCNHGNSYTTPASTWHHKSGLLTQLVVQNGKFFGVNKHDNLYFAPSQYSEWIFFHNIHFKQVDYDYTTNTICGCKSDNKLFCGPDDNVNGNAWYNVAGDWQYISIRNGKMFGIDSRGDLWFTSEISTNPNWTQLPAPRLNQISFDGDNTICGHMDGAIYCANQQIEFSPLWVEVPNYSPVMYIDVSKKTHGI